MAKTVTERDLDAFIEHENERWKRFAGSWDDESDKHFEVNARSEEYRVFDHSVCVYEGSDKTEAIRIYNNLR